MDMIIFHIHVHRVRIVANRKGGNCYQLVSSHIHLYAMVFFYVLIFRLEFS